MNTDIDAVTRMLKRAIDLLDTALGDSDPMIDDDMPQEEIEAAYPVMCSMQILTNLLTIQCTPTAPAQSCGDAEQADGAVDAFLAEVRAELIRARAKFPGDRIMTIALAEEFGELCKAVLDESAANVRKEAVQTAVMCARVVLDGDGSVNDWRAERGLDPLVKDSK